MEIILVLSLASSVIIACVVMIIFLYQRNSALFAQKILFEEKSKNSESLLSELKIQNQNLSSRCEELNRDVFEFQKQNELLQQSKFYLQQEQQDWESRKNLLLEQMAHNILAKNREDQDKFSVDQQNIIKKTTEDLFKNFESVVSKVVSLSDDLKKSNDDVELTKNALLRPDGAGRTSEITLGNILKNSGLREITGDKKDGDFILQAHFNNSVSGAKRPDALVFLPGDHILIIDSKSSPYFLELQKARNEGDNIRIREMENKIKDAMRRHIDDLKKRDYAGAKLKELGFYDDSEAKTLLRVTTIMFLQSEKMLETIRQIDENFEERAWEENIFVASPIGLVNLLVQSKLIIHRSNQEKNIDKLKVEIRKLADAVNIIFDRSQNLGQAIEKSMKAFDEFSGSFNRRLLPTVRNMNKLGIDFDQKLIAESIRKISKDEE